VMVWDKGTYEALSASPAKELAEGKLHFILHGKKLSGEWYLVRLRGGNQWLLIKGGKNHARISVKQDDTSAASGKSMKQLGESNRVWQSHRTVTRKGLLKMTQNGETHVRRSRTANPASRGKAAALRFIEPMKARLVETVPAGEWIYEIKFDGYRALALKQGGEVELLSRNKKPFNEKFPHVVEALSKLDVGDAIIDGEIVALDEKGRSSFQLLQAFELNEKKPPLFFYVFDLVRLNGKDLKSRPLAERKSLLRKLIKNEQGVIRFSTSLEGEVKAILAQVRRLGLEGLIGKRPDSTYEAGQRSGAWIKLKIHQEQEFVIGGYTPPGGSRRYLGALVVGFFEKGELTFAGKVGTGFNDKLLRELHTEFAPLVTGQCPFANLPEKKGSRYGQALTPGEMKKCHWLKPKLVCQIKFAEWTRDAKLRQPVFLGLREDKDASEVVREVPKDL